MAASSASVQVRGAESAARRQTTWSWSCCQRRGSGNEAKSGNANVPSSACAAAYPRASIVSAISFAAASGNRGGGVLEDEQSGAGDLTRDRLAVADGEERVAASVDDESGMSISGRRSRHRGLQLSLANTMPKLRRDRLTDNT
jgi:hypothetical protein